MSALQQALAELPLVAILRGIRPEEAEAAGDVLAEAGFRLIEVPLNSPEPLRSIRLLAKRLASRALVGAGTVMTAEAAREVVEAGGRLVVMPHSDAAVIGSAKAAGAWCLPGVATPTEGFAALRAGADGLKLFPGEALPPPVLKAWRAVFSAEVRLLPVGGVTPENMAAYLAAGASGFGIGSALYRPGTPPQELARRAGSIAAAWRAARDVTP